MDQQPIALAMEHMTDIMSIQHIFDDQFALPDGGPFKYVLEIGNHCFCVFRSDRNGNMIVSPLRQVDFLEDDESEEPVVILHLSVLSWSRFVGRLRSGVNRRARTATGRRL